MKRVACKGCETEYNKSDAANLFDPEGYCPECHEKNKRCGDCKNDCKKCQIKKDVDKAIAEYPKAGTD